MNQPILEYVKNELAARRGTWRDIAKELEGENWESYYSWLEKVANGRIPDPGVNKIQRLLDHFRAQGKKVRASPTAAKSIT